MKLGLYLAPILLLIALCASIYWAYRFYARRSHSIDYLTFAITLVIICVIAQELADLL